MCVCVCVCVCVCMKIDPEEQDLEENKLNIFDPYNSILNGFYFWRLEIEDYKKL